MDHVKKCTCCNQIIESQFCGYCGFMNIAALDKPAEQKMAEEAQKWRRELIGQLSDYRVVSYEYGWKETESEFGLLHTKTKTLADGSQCDGKVFWTGIQFEQLPESSETPVAIELSYKFHGKEKRLDCEIIPAACEGLWQIGLEITEQMQLVVYLGNEHIFAKSAPLALELT